MCFKKTKITQSQDTLPKELLAFIQNIDDQFVSSPNITMLKDGDTTTVVKLTLEEHAYVIKRYNWRNWRYRLLHLFKPSRASISWHFAHFLKSIHLTTPKPIAKIDVCWFGLYTHSYFITEYIDAETLTEHIKQASDKTMIQKTRSMIQKLHDQGVIHGDCKATNFLIHKPDSIYLIDLDGMRYSKKVLLQKKDLARFEKNFVKI